MSKIFNKNKYNSDLIISMNKGLTIIELLVVVSIFMIITGITVFNYNSFNSSISTQNLADDIALTIRKAQGYAIGVRGLGVNKFDYGYGIHFTTNNSNSSLKSGSSTSFILFTDINDNKVYDYSEDIECGTFENGDECVEVLNIKSADEIKEILVNSTLEDSVDILFKRPKPEPNFYINGGIEPATSVDIKVSGPDLSSATKFIKVSNTGQISVSSKKQ